MMKEQYRIRNWSEYNAGLKRRGSITFWLSTGVIEEWLVTTKTGSRGASKTYNDIAIATMSTVNSIFSWAGRQAQGFVESTLQLMNINLPANILRKQYSSRIFLDVCCRVK